MGVLSEGNVRVSLPARHGARRRWTASSTCCRGWCAGVRERLGRPAAGRRAASAAPDAASLVVDALGRRCPIPVIELAKVIGEVPVGGTVTVLSDDEAARLDIPAWCEMREQEYVGEEPADRGSAYVVRRLL